MKLAKVNHYRCRQPAGKWGLHTFVWVPDNMIEEDFAKLCEIARNSYLEIERERDKAVPVNPGYEASIQGYADTLTVAEVKADYQAKAKAYKEYTAKTEAARQPFSWHLERAGGGTIKLFWSETPAMSHDLDWGHKHGTTIDYGETHIPNFPLNSQEDD